LPSDRYSGIWVFRRVGFRFSILGETGRTSRQPVSNKTAPPSTGLYHFILPKSTRTQRRIDKTDKTPQHLTPNP
jgi:hypothetical protein